MTNVQVNNNGRMVYFTLGGETDAEKLGQALEDMGLGKFAPSSNTSRIALKLGCQSVCSKGVRFLRDLKGERGYAVVSQRKDETSGELTFRVDFSAVTDLEGDITFRIGDEVPTNPGGYSLLDTKWPTYQQVLDDMGRVRARALVESTRCQASTVARSLVGLVDRFHGVSLRESGGIYWLPAGPNNAVLDKWSKVAEAFTACGGGRNIIYALQTEVDEDTAFAIMDALVREVKKEREQMEERFHGLEHGASDDRHKRALATMESRIKTLRGRVKGYESIVGRNLDGLRTELSECEQVLGFSVLANSVGL